MTNRYVMMINTLFITLWLLFVADRGVAQQSNTSVKYALEVISDWKEYELKNLPKDYKLVPLDTFLQPFFRDIRYKTNNNFTGVVLYQDHSLWLARKAAQQLRLVQDSVLKRGLNLLVFDAYRPYCTTVAMWEKVPDERYAANPAKGSGHNRGIAIDLTLADAATGLPIEMPTGYDNFSDTAHYSFTNLPAPVLQNRALLRGIMEHFGFNALSTEWWHFSLPGATAYPLLDLTFQSLAKRL